MLPNGRTRSRTSSYEGRTAKTTFDFLGPATIGAAVAAGVTTDSSREVSKSTGAVVRAEGSDGFRMVKLTAESHKQVQDSGYYCTQGKV